MQPIKRVVTAESNLYLSFDDGPCPVMTPQVLDLLESYDAKATFFLIGEKATKEKELVRRILDEGHAVGNHSMDHNYINYFNKKNHLIEWVQSSHNLFKNQFDIEPIGFRSPAGVVTPPLREAMNELGIPWIHWSRRFFDTSIPLPLTGFFQKFSAGDIILLHDVQRKPYRKAFLGQLERLLGVQKNKGFDFKALKNEDL